MIRLQIKLALAALTLICSSGAENDSSLSSVDATSSADLADYYPAAQLGWSRLADSSALIVSRVSRKTDEPITSTAATKDVDPTTSAPPRRERRDLGSEAKLEKIAGSKSVREARLLGSPETWSKQPLAVQFRTRAESLPLDRYDDGPASDIDEAANLPPLIRAHYAPKTDFVTSGRSRTVPEARPPFPPGEARESRELPIARSYDEYDVPIFRNVVREHEFDVQLPRNYYYPNPSPSRYRSQRDYYYRATGGAPPSPYAYDRYRDDEEDYERFGRYNSPSTPKPKRIIYYATLPEIVRKPVDLRSYQRPYDPLARAPEAPLVDADRSKPASNNIEASPRRPLRYPYDNYDNYVKRSSFYDRRRPAYAVGDDDRARDLERSRANYKEKLQRSDDRKYDGNQLARSDNDRRLPWPVQIGTEVNVKSDDRIPGRNIFGQVENYDTYDGSRIKKDNAERKEDVHQDINNDSSNNNGDRNNNNN